MIEDIDDYLDDNEDPLYEDDDNIDIDLTLEELIAEYIESKGEITQQDQIEIINRLSQEVGSQRLLDHVPVMNDKELNAYVKKNASMCNNIDK